MKIEGKYEKIKEIRSSTKSNFHEIPQSSIIGFMICTCEVFNAMKMRSEIVTSWAKL